MEMKDKITRCIYSRLFSISAPKAVMEAPVTSVLPPTAAVAGGVSGGVIAVVIVIIIVVVLLKR